MTIPASLVIGAHTFEVRSDEDTSQLLHEGGYKGDSHVDRLLIRVDSTRPHSAVAETLLHEAIHCAWHQTYLRVDHDSDSEERAVTTLAPLLLGMLRSNPDLVAYLTGDGP